MARVYVGTYAKYNSGSLAGAWINLDDCADYSEFLAKCAATHKDERDPEFMIQDAEAFPDGLSCMEWLSEAEFNDVKAAMKEEAEGEAPVASYTVVDYSEKAIAVTGDTRAISDKLKALGGRFNPRLSCGAGWIFSKKKESEVRALLAGSQVGDATAPKKEKEVEAGAEFIATLDEWVSGIQKGDKDYYRKHNAAAVKLPEGYFVISKPSIENKFCFHDEGPDYETYKSLHKSEAVMRDYFLRENLSDLDRQIKSLEDMDETMFLAPTGWQSEVLPRTSRYMSEWARNAEREEAREMTESERKQCAAALRFVRAGFEKRLQTYLKRYGVSKIHTWTYWADA